METSEEITVYLLENPALLGELANEEFQTLGIADFSSYQIDRAAYPEPPHPPIAAIYQGENQRKRIAFDEFNRTRKLAHQKAVVEHDKKKRRYEILNLYAGDMAGYGAFLISHHPEVTGFFGMRRPFPINEESRRLHTYITGGSGSGKSECIKSHIWHYLTKDVSSALVFIDPHNDIARQVAKFRPNRDNGRLVYIEPRFNDQVFPGLNPFDIDGKEGMSDMVAEDYAGEFIAAFREILDGNLTEQMETLLKYTIPVLIKMPDTSVYDLIRFLKPKKKEGRAAPEADGQPVDTEEYEAQRYLDFARENFDNLEMLYFLAGQFDDDSGYVTTRNSLTTRLMGIFGGTLMQAMFRGRRTVRFEDLIPQRKLVVFNLAGLGSVTGTVGKFVLITLKIFALNQAKVPLVKRHPCHVFVDECQKFVTESMADILQEARKFQVFLTLAQQSAGARMTSALFDAVLTNCATMIAGVNNGPSLDVMAKATGVPATTLAGFRKGQFAVFQREAKPRLAIVRMPTNTLRDSASMASQDWKRLLNEQLRDYYREPPQGGGNAYAANAKKGALPCQADMLNLNLSHMVN